MTGRHRLAAGLLAAMLGLAGLPGCSTNPATGGSDFTLLSPEDERRIGREQHPRIVAEFGGRYRDEAVQAYVEGLGTGLAAGSELAGTPFAFTVLDSPMVNAFALPGGYVYVTRGLLALAGSEAELAGVLGHEIGHVTARHGARQHGRSVIVGLGAAILGAAIGDRGAAELLNRGSGLVLRSYSREQEFEADGLGLRYMARAGYDPEAMASFLERLRAKAAFDAEAQGGGADPDGFSLASTHPRTVDRVHEARAAVLGAGPVEGRTGRDEYLRRLDGMVWGDSADQGFVRGQRFVHPVLRFEFTVPPAFTLTNLPTVVRAHAANGAVILFDTADAPAGASMPAYLRDGWGRQLPLSDLTRLTIDGAEAATGAARVSTGRGPYDLRLLAIRGDPGRVFRFLFATPAAETARMTEGLQRTSLGFRRLTEAEAAREQPYRLRIHRMRPGDTLAALARHAAGVPNAEALLRVLNGLQPGQEPAAGQLVKYVAG